MTGQNDISASLPRRDALKLSLAPILFAGAMLAGTKSAKAQTASDIDALNLMVTFEYLLAQFLTAGYGISPSAGTNLLVAVPADRLTGDGVPGTPVIPGRVVTNFSTITKSVVLEMANDDRNHLLPMRSVVGVPVVRQPLIDLSAATGPFTVLMRRAGVIAAGASFDPYASETNFLYVLFYLKSTSVAAYRGLLPTLSNRVVMQNFAGLLAAHSIHLTTVRSMLYERDTTTRANADKIAAFQNTLNGGGTVFQGLSPRSRPNPSSASTTLQVSNVVPAQPTGEVVGITAARVLNQLFVTNTAATAGGFYPEGIFGNIRTSAGA